jgi:hypothetical protein
LSRKWAAEPDWFYQAERGAVSEKAMKQLASRVRASAEYLTVFRLKFYPRRLKEKYLDGLT